MNHKILRIAAALALSLTTFAGLNAMAKPDTASIASNAEHDPPAIAFLRSKGYVIGRHFDAGHGLTGWVVVRAGNPNVVFTPKDGQVALIGALVDVNGNNLASSMLEQYGANPGLPAAFDALAAGSFVAIKPRGATRRVVYVMFDANCPYCSVIYRATQKYRDAGVEFRWVPVAYLQADSGPRAAAIFAAADPAQALDQNETGFDETKHAGGITPLSTMSDDFKRQLDKNDHLMQSIGSSVTPTFLWKDETGQVYQYQGLPPPEVMTNILGLAGGH